MLVFATCCSTSKCVIWGGGVIEIRRQNQELVEHLLLCSVWSCPILQVELIFLNYSYPHAERNYKRCHCALFVALSCSMGFISACLLHSLIRVGASLLSLHATEQTGPGFRLDEISNRLQNVFITHVSIFRIIV